MYKGELLCNICERLVEDDLKDYKIHCETVIGGIDHITCLECLSEILFYNFVSQDADGSYNKKEVKNLLKLITDYALRRKINEDIWGYEARFFDREGK